MISKKNFLYVGILVIIIFSVGISIGLNYDSIRKGVIERDTKIFEVQMEDFIITNEIIRNLIAKDCRLIEPYLVNVEKQSEDLANSLQNFENKGLIQDENFKLLKQKYFLHELEYWLNIEKYKECNPNITTILFFYGYNDESIKQGFVLTELREEYAGKVYVFSFDVDNIDNNAVKLITSLYGISQSPSLVINSDKVITGFVSLDSLRNMTKLQ